MNNITFTMIKPKAFELGHTGAILDMILKSGFQLKAMKLVWLSTKEAEQFYIVHKERGFFKELVEAMSFGPIVAIVLEKENAVADFRKLIGSTDPANAEEGTIRKRFATNLTHNAVHGSDSDDNALIEANFFFSSLDRV